MFRLITLQEKKYKNILKNQTFENIYTKIIKNKKIINLELVNL